MMFEPLESRRLLAGVTLLTHGYLGSIDGWISNTADDIVTRLGGKSAATEATLTIALNSKNRLAVTSYKRDSGYGTPSQTTTGEIIVKLDWSSVSDGTYSTTQVAAVASDFLMNGNADGMHLASLPMQLVGHSRGASLVTAMSYDLGRAGVWVDQQTSLDAHPVDGSNDLGGADFGDMSMATYDNVIYADAYWRTDGDANNFDFDGEPVDGAANHDLNATVQANFVGSAHLSVPSYYDGTVNLSATFGGDTPIMSGWYGTGSGSSSKPARNATGFDYTRIVGGLRELDGLWTASSGTGTRTDAGQSGLQWADVSDVRVLGGRTFRAGQSIKLRYIREDRDNSSTISFFLDTDTNPFNNNNIRTLRTTNLGSVSTVTANRATGSTTGAGAGTYWVQARITDRSGHVRYAYSKSFKLIAESASPLSVSRIGTAPNSISGDVKDRMVSDAGNLAATIDSLL